MCGINSFTAGSARPSAARIFGVAVLAQGQVAAIAAWVSDDLVGFVERLGNIQGFPGAEAKLFRADFLQGAEVEGQARRRACARYAV